MGPVIINKNFREILPPLPILLRKAQVTTQCGPIITECDSFTTECAPKQTTPDPPPQPFRFLDLPSELRNEIYRCLLHKETRQRLGLSAYTYKPGNDLDPFKGWLELGYNNLQPAILATNHAIHDEAAAIMYGTQPFSVSIKSLELTTVWTVGRAGQKMLVAPRYMRLIGRFQVQVELANCCLGSSRFRSNMWLLWSNIHSFCQLVQQNSLVRVEIDFNNMLLRQAMASVFRCPDMNVRLEGQETLDAFLLLRNVRNVAITGDVEPLYALQLKAFMENSTHIPSVL